MKKLAVCLFGTLLSSCAATGPQFSGDANSIPGYAVVYVYSLNNDKTTHVYIDDHRESLGDYGYLEFQLEEGDYEILIRDGLLGVSLGGDDQRATISAKPGESYFFKAYQSRFVNYMGEYSYTAKLGTIDPKIALLEMKYTKKAKQNSVYLGADGPLPEQASL